VDVADLEGLWPTERAAVERAILHRQVEFATGRALLRHLLDASVEIGVESSRRPVLPHGVVGTLAHDHQIALGAVTTHPLCCALGVDLEPAGGLSPEDAGVILRPEERDLDVHLVFVLKEAVYKAWSSLGGRLIEHHDVAVDIDDARGRFTETVLPCGSRLSGRYTAALDRYIALVVVETT
jgi:4'-phosphopantetheinyl transferase EntD